MTLIYTIKEIVPRVRLLIVLQITEINMEQVFDFVMRAAGSETRVGVSISCLSCTVLFWVPAAVTDALEFGRVRCFV